MAASIFDKQAILKPSAMKTVAERRFDDAQTLRDTEMNARANGVAYLGGFVIEILLKAKLVEQFPKIAKLRGHEVTTQDREIWSLIWRQHDLTAMLDRLPQLEAELKKKGEREGYDYYEDLKKICATWTIYARYSSQTIQMSDAGQFLSRVRKLKESLK
jgi:hypothetical protein